MVETPELYNLKNEKRGLACISFCCLTKVMSIFVVGRPVFTIVCVEFLLTLELLRAPFPLSVTPTYYPFLTIVLCLPIAKSEFNLE